MTTNEHSLLSIDPPVHRGRLAKSSGVLILLAIVATFLLIEAAGLCSTFGHIVIG